MKEAEGKGGDAEAEGKGYAAAVVVAMVMVLRNCGRERPSGVVGTTISISVSSIERTIDVPCGCILTVA